MFTFAGVGRAGAKPEIRDVNTPRGKVPVLTVPVYFDGLELFKNGKKIKDIPGRITVWEERDQKWLKEYCKPGSLLKVTASQFRLGTYEGKVQIDGQTVTEHIVSLDITAETIRFANFGTNNNSSGNNNSNEKSNSTNKKSFNGNNSYNTSNKSEIKNEDPFLNDDILDDDDPFDLGEDIDLELIEGLEDE